MEPKIGRHTIESDADIFLFIGRAILSTERIKFLQTMDARGTFRSIGAVGLMAQSSNNMNRDAPEKPPSAATEQQALSDLLISGGIHWKLAKEIAFQFGSASALKAAFDECSCGSAKEVMLIPILNNMGEVSDCPGDLAQWSRAISFAFRSSKDIRVAKRRTYQDIIAVVGNNTCDPALLLCSVYTNENADAALNEAMDRQLALAGGVSVVGKRLVSVDISPAFGPCFAEPKQASFYSLCLATNDNPWSLPSCQLSTSSRDFSSGKLTVSLIEGTRVVEDVSESVERDSNASTVEMAKIVAAQIASICTGSSKEANRRILLVRGLGNALGMAAKKANYREDTIVLCEMVFAALMMDHNIVVLRAIRKKQEETSMILRQLALACYHFQLLQHEVVHSDLT